MTSPMPCATSSPPNPEPSTSGDSPAFETHEFFPRNTPPRSAAVSPTGRRRSVTAEPFRKGGTNLPVCSGDRQRVTTFSETVFEQECQRAPERDPGCRRIRDCSVSKIRTSQQTQPFCRFQILSISSVKFRRTKKFPVTSVHICSHLFTFGQPLSSFGCRCFGSASSLPVSDRSMSTDQGPIGSLKSATQTIKNTILTSHLITV